ncbi:MAG: hypothetical protein IPK83_12675 [Planctomycetes bacterium]|nr:hypothetical protein [Planctomycetota bacterium]
MAMGEFGQSPPNVKPDGWTRLSAALSRVYYPDRAVKKHFNDHFDYMIRATAKRDDGSIGELVDEDKMFEKVPAWDIVSRMLMPSLSRAHELTLQGESNFVRAEVSLAVAAYKLDKGVPPPTLSALVPQYLPDVPADPMTGYDFEYAPAGGDGKPTGIAQLTRESADELRKKRRTPAILTPRASKWRRFVMGYAKRHEFSDSQRSSAEAILRDIEARAASFERTQGATLQSLIDAGQAEAAMAKMGPLDELFVELKRRLDTLPTAKQRASAKDQIKEGAGQ